MVLRSCGNEGAADHLSPGSIAEVSVPQSMVNAGFSILVGAHTIDMTEKWIFNRMDRVSTSFPITKSVMRVANPLGGGIYIVVPYLANLGKVSVAVKNVIEAPLFSYKSWHKTTAAEWQTRRTAPAPWADFESDKYLMQVPRSWVYASGDQTALMRNWDTAMDGVSELMSFPPDKRNRTIQRQPRRADPCSGRRGVEPVLLTAHAPPCWSVGLDYRLD